MKAAWLNDGVTIEMRGDGLGDDKVRDLSGRGWKRQACLPAGTAASGSLTEGFASVYCDE